MHPLYFAVNPWTYLEIISFLEPSGQWGCYTRCWAEEGINLVCHKSIVSCHEFVDTHQLHFYGLFWDAGGCNAGNVYHVHLTLYLVMCW